MTRWLVLLLLLCAAPVSAETPHLNLGDFLGQAYFLDNEPAYAALDAAMVEAMAANSEGKQLAYEVLLCGARDYRKDIEEALHDDITAPLVKEAARVDALIARWEVLAKHPVACGFDACTIGKICKCYGLWHPERNECRVCTVMALVECRSWWDGGERCKTDEGRMWLQVIARVEKGI